MKAKFKISDFITTKHKNGIEGIVTAITERYKNSYSYELSYINTEGDPSTEWFSEIEIELTKKDNKKNIGFKGEKNERNQRILPRK